MPENSTTTPGTDLNLELEVEFEPAAVKLVSVATEEKSEPAAAEENLEMEFGAPAVTAETSKKELVSVYLLAMHLPSGDLVAEDYTEELGRAVRRRVKEWHGDAARIAREIENMRRNIYRRIERLWCLVREFGVWVTVTEVGIREAERVSREVRERLRHLGLEEVASRYFVRAVKVYLEPQDAKMLLDAAVNQLRVEVEELEKRIKAAETAQNRRQVSELMRKKEYAKSLMEIFKKYIDSISR